MTLLHRCHIARRRIIFPSSTPTATTPSALTPTINRLQNLSITPSTQPSPRTFTTSNPLLARKKQQQRKDHRITLIRYHLQHPLTPRPLRFSRNRALRHWTIHRAYQLFRSKQREARETELQRQFQSMSAACEALRLVGEDGLAISEGGNVMPPRGAADPQFIGFERGTGRVVPPERLLRLREKARDGGLPPVGEDAPEAVKRKEVQFLDLRAASERQREVGRLYNTAMLKTGVWEGVPIEYARAQTETPPRNGWDHGWTR